MAIDGGTLDADRYSLSDALLTIAGVPDAFELRTVTRIRPHANTKLSGLYRSADGYFTQCEAQGFRRITWFPDRPDVMSRYTVTMHAGKDVLPLLLANGNPVGSGDEGRATRTDGTGRSGRIPSPSPAICSRMVAARLDVLRDTYLTRSGPHRPSSPSTSSRASSTSAATPWPR